MKQLIVLITILLFTGNAFAEKISQDNIPAVVLNAFQLKYPNAEDVSWKLDAGKYYVHFRVKSKENKLVMDYKGTTLRHSQDLYISEVPMAVQETILTKLPYFDVHDADRYEIGDSVTYEVRFRMDGKNHFFWINEDGQLLKYRKELRDNEIPSIILSEISNTYGKLDIDRSKYVAEGDSVIYIIRGVINGSHHFFMFDDKAVILEHTQDLQNDEIPTSVMNTVTKDFNGFDIRDADLIEENGTKHYILRMKKSRKQVKVTFDASGKVLEVK